jgi:hypothetical protein
MLLQEFSPRTLPLTTFSRHPQFNLRSESEPTSTTNVRLDFGLWHHQAWENALKQHGEGRSLGVPPLRATDFLTR